MSSNTKKTVKGLSSQAVVTLVLGFLEIVSFSIMSRLLTKDDFGLFAAVSAIVTIFSTISEAGLGASLVQRKNLDSRFTDNVFTLSLIMGLTLSSLLVLFSGLLSKAVLGEGLTLALMLMSVTLLMHSLSSVNISLLQRNYRFITIGIIYVIALVISTVVAIILALYSYGFYSIIAKVIISPVIVYILTLISAKTRFHLRLDKESIKDILNFSGWFMLSRLLRTLSKQLDRLLMPRLMSVETLGAYTRPKEFIDQISAKINGIFDTALFPVLSTLQDDTKRLRVSLSKSIYYLNLFSTILSLAFIFNSKLIIRIFFGQNWLYLVPVFIVLSVSVAFNADGRLADCYFRSMGRTRQQFFFRIGELLAKFSGVIIGANWGLIGVAVGVTVSESAMRVAKLLYIAVVLKTNRNEILSWFTKSWQPLFFILPICITSFILLPDSLAGDIVMSLVFIVVCFLAFVLLPCIVGGRYYAELYPNIRIRIRERLHIQR